MEPVKITNVEAWSSIDIFLFSNGQQYSPPRKYHLRSEELQWWGATMSYLGRTHYGSGHSSIELYAVNGTKINGPLELIHGAAYVAVEPPDFFINTGYEEYLLRASSHYRSWEKRTTQKSYNTEAINLDLSRVKDPTVLSNTNNTAENITDTALMNGNAIISTQKTRPIKPYHRLQRKSITNPKQIQKKKSCDTHGTLLKRNCAEIDKAFPCPKKTSINKNACKNLKASGIVACKPNETTTRESSSCCKKRHPIKPDSNPKTEASKDLNVNDTESVRRPLIIDLFKNDESDSISLKNDPGLYPVIDQSMYHHEKNNFTEDNATVSNEFVHKIKTDNNQDFEKLSSSKLKQINEYEQSNMLPKNYYLKNEVERDLQDNIPVINNNNENKSNDHFLNNKSEKQVIDEYVAHMNKGGLLLLKLKVKLKDCKTIFNKDKIKNLPTMPSLSDLPITDKTSQVDINISFSGELLNDQRNTQDKSLQSLLNKLYAEETNYINTKDRRIIILQCACRDYSNSHKCCMCNTIQGCEIVDGQCEAGLNQNLSETFNSCECHAEALKNSKGEGTSQNGTIIQTVTDAHKNTMSLSKSNGLRVKDLARKFEKSNGRISNSNNKQNSNKTSINENHRQSVVLTRLIGTPIFEMATENPLEEENNIANSKRICSKSTQTEWCNVLLEAKLQDDDNYSFHLPPLYILKQCNL